MMRNSSILLVNIKSKATKKISVDIVASRKASKFRTLQENDLFELEVAGNAASHRFDTRVSNSYGTAN